MHSITNIAIVVTAALFGVVFAGHLPHGHASSYASVVQHFRGHHHDHHGYGQHSSNPHIARHIYDQHHHNVHHHEPHHHPKYQFEYGVKDAHTGDHKSQWEQRDGDRVKGGYTFVEADGTIRVVEYTADKHSGFKAVVKRIGHAHHPQANAHAGSHPVGYDARSYKRQGHGHASSYYGIEQHY